MGTNFDGIFDNSGECNTDLDLFAFPAVSCPGENSGSINLYIGQKIALERLLMNIFGLMAKLRKI